MSNFQAGIGVREMTPPPGAPLWGYMDREGPATGALDPLYCRAVAFRGDDTTVVVASLDLGRTPAGPVESRIRSRAAVAGADHTLLLATHTHHAPIMEDPEAPYMPEIEQAIGDAIAEACANLEPVHWGIETVEIDIGHNRRIVRDGRCEMLWRNEERRSTHPVDRTATIIRLDRADGAPLACLVQYACHPVIMGPSNLEYSGDYVGELCRIVKEETGAECVFLQGACGDINPYLDKTPLAEGGVEAMRGEGRNAAAAVLRGYTAIKAQPVDNAAVAFKEEQVTVGTRWDLEDSEQRHMFFDFYDEIWKQFYAAAAVPDLAVPINTVMLNSQVAILGMPGEIFAHYQLSLRESAPVAHPLLCGYANGYYAYFPTVKDALAGGYGGTVGSFVGIGAADMMMTRGQRAMAELLGAVGRPAQAGDFAIVDAE